jgi:hypothetical protein
VFDNHGTNDQSSIFGGAPLCGGKSLVMSFSQSVQENAFAHLDSADVVIQCGLEGPIEFSAGGFLVALSDHEFGASVVLKRSCWTFVEHAHTLRDEADVPEFRLQN